MTRTVVPAVILLAALACTPATGEFGDAEREMVRAEVAAVFDTLSRAMVGHDWDRLEPIFADGDDVALAMDGNIVLGRETIMRGFRADSSIKEYLEYRWENTRIRVMGPDAAIHSTGFWERLAMTSGDTVEIRGTFTNGFQRIDGRWHVVHMAASHAPAGG